MSFEPRPVVGTLSQHAEIDLDRTFLEHARRCYAVAFAVVRDPHLAEDVVQDVFETLCLNPSRFDPDRGTLQTWLNTVTHHKAVDLIRNRRRRVHLDVDATQADDVAGLYPDPAEAAAEGDFFDRLRLAVSRLAPGQQSVLRLAYLEGYTREEIARIMGIPLGTVKSRIHHALRHLQAALDEANFADRPDRS